MSDDGGIPRPRRQMFFPSAGVRPGGSFEDMEREVAERTFRINRLHLAAQLLGGVLARKFPGGNIVFSDQEREEALTEAEKLMAANEARKVVML